MKMGTPELRGLALCALVLSLAPLGAEDAGEKNTDKPAAPAPSEPAKAHAFTLAQPADGPQDGPQDGSRLARELVRTFMTDEAYAKRVDEVKARYARWHAEHKLEMDRFLNDRLPGLALAAFGAKVEHLQEGALWLSFYHEFHQPTHSLATSFITDNHASLARLFADFTWAKASQYVKDRQWAKDKKTERDEEKKKKETAKKSDQEREK